MSVQPLVIDSILERPCIKPTSPVIKRLFDFSDPSETKKMFNEMSHAESKRLEKVWNFDIEKLISAGQGGGNYGKSNIDPPVTYKRYHWQIQERHNVPYFYTRPFRRHHSERRKGKDIFSLKAKYVHEIKNTRSPLPLKSRDGNIQRQFECSRSTVKQSLKFTNPPKISDELATSPSLVRFVTALRVPLTNASVNSVPPVQMDTGSDGDKRKRTNASSAPSSQSTCNKSIHEMNSASRQLFEKEKTRKRSADSFSHKQPKITDLVPHKKLRPFLQKNAPKSTKKQDESPPCSRN